MLLLSLAPAPSVAQVGPQLTGPRPQSAPTRPGPPQSAQFDLWDAQERLIGQSIAQLPERVADAPNAYVVAIAPLGRQQLFSREAKAALQAISANFDGPAKAGILLSNHSTDVMQAPLATQRNIAQILEGIGRRTRANPDDMVIVYLASHGGEDATLETALPRNQPTFAISARSMAEALDSAGIRRRVIIISACFAGSWIPALANDDTIVIAAAAANRTSFGCAEDRDLTYFGEAFLTGPFSKGASLETSFEGAKMTVTQWEQAEKLLNSLPQAYVGKNMQGLWQRALRPQPAPATPATSRKIATKR